MNSSVATIRPVETSAPRAPTTTPRMLYLDNLKVVLVVGVIAAHAATHYIGGGEWVKHGTTAPAPLLTVLGVLGLAGGLFWIGLFFLMAGMLAPASLAHHGPRRFLRDRIVRLGIPFVIYVVLVMPLLHYSEYVLTYRSGGTPQPLWTWAHSHVWPPDAGPLWFVADLLLFSVGYAIWWQIRPRREQRSGTLGLRYIALLCVCVAVPSFLLHLIWPLFTSQFLDLHLSQWPQYVTLFWFGTLIAERALMPLPAHTWKWCGWASVGAAAAVPILGVMGGALSGHTDLITGGWHWEALGTVGIEGVLSVCGSLWLLEYFRRHYNRQGDRTRALARSSYGAYIAHEPLLIAGALALTAVTLPVEGNFLILAPVTVAMSFGVAWLVIVRLKLATGIL